ncbi:F-box protein CPR1-like [Silene latifolia]|uniref:F-box protein CPR1-like n=1 Tax=Silene latifolia TaxID=37657 RepID=UPI003D76FC9D
MKQKRKCRRRRRRRRSHRRRSLPDDIIMEILSRLPVKTLLRFKSASKSLLNLIISLEFVKLHLRQSIVRNSNITLLHWGEASLAYFDFDHPQRPVVQFDVHPDVIKLLESYRFENSSKLYFPIFIGICNGVVCFGKAKEFVLYNPATRDYRQIPRLRMRELNLAIIMPNDELYRKIRFSDVFFYDCNSDDFKIFSSVHHITTPNQNDFEFYLYSLKNNSWLKIESPPQGLRVDPSRTHIANNSLYWVTLKDNGLQPKVIMRFDLSSHRYGEMSTPKQINPAHILRVRVLKGRPHVLILGSHFDIWMITEDNFWTPVFRCLTKQCPWMYEYDSPFWRNHISAFGYGYSRDGRKILIGPVKNPQRFICCDLVSQTTSDVQLLGLPEDVSSYAMSWAESLVLLA